MSVKPGGPDQLRFSAKDEFLASITVRPHGTSSARKHVKRVSIVVTGFPVFGTSLACALATAAVNMEVPIIATSLVKIVEDLNGFEQQGWVITGYLITYTTLLVIWAKLSAITGRKTANIASCFIFTVFSGGCGAAQTMHQLIILRTFQGIGAAGMQACATATVYELVPKEKVPVFASMIMAATALGSLFGPMIGGALSEKGQWRWVFLINVPLGAVIMLLFSFSIPANFPYQNNPRYKPPTLRQRFKSLRRLDFAGTILLLTASVLLVAAILEGGIAFKWDSAASIVLFTISGLLFIAFIVNERIVSGDKVEQEPLFPWRFVTNRVWLGTLALSLLCAVPYNTALILLPQRFQIVEGDSPFRSGLRLIPFNLFVAVGAVIANAIAGKLKVPPMYVCVVGAIIESVGVGLLSTLPKDSGSPGLVYFYEILGGLGVGIPFGISLGIVPYIIDKRDTDIGGGCALQARIFGGALGLSIATTVLNNHLSSHFGAMGQQAQDRLQADAVSFIASLPPTAQHGVIEVFGEGYSIVFKIMAGFAVAQVFAVILMYRNPPVSMSSNQTAE
ncbi:MFS general substrate transporter [Rhizodiscina lignyota]|uniref:MFS general substrate transporter n=1 Tax=Rhizodiscina lignyota TaxID=1504668 RepID=A0A9P4ILI7_9PEZI|nr:MFS general substrate transporter [Rhizodiscina lignyota]